MIGVGVHNSYIYIFFGLKDFGSYFKYQLAFSNMRSRTSRRIEGLALPLLSPETLSSLNKLRIFLLNAHLALFV